MSEPEARAAVLTAAATLLDAFAHGDLAGYFGAFAPDATFVFHSVAEPLPSTAAYRQAWSGWVETVDLRILGCTSHDQAVTFLTPDVALFTHSVRVSAYTRDGTQQRRERETIVFVRQPDGRWLGAHEHLSPDPNP